jgi:hypothetical protein
MTYAETFRRLKIKFQNQWRRLGLKKNWATFILIAILLPIYWFFEYGLDCIFFALAGVISIYFLFLRKR